MNKKAVASDILWLAMCWALTLTTSTLLTTIGPLSADELGASTIASPFTIGVFLFGAAFSSVPSGPLFRKYGRLKGFSVGCLCQVIGSVLGSGGMMFEELALVFAGCFFVGLGQGLGQFYRFSAVEIAPQDFKSQAITYVLSGGVIAAFLGPTTAKYTSDIIGKDYLGSYLVMGLIGILNQMCVMMVNFPAPPSATSATANVAEKQTLTQKLLADSAMADDASEKTEEGCVANTNGASVANLGSDGIDATLIQEQNLQLPESRPLMVIISQPLFIISCAVATIAHTQMVMIMSNCSLAMSLKYDYSFTNTARVMEVHFFAMFAPGFFTGKLIEGYGAFLVALLGAVVFVVSSVVFVIGTDLWNFYLGMALLGVAWNFSFSAGTVMLTGSYRKNEATDVQAINDFILFTVAGIGSLVSGVIYSSLGWFDLIYIVTGMCLFNIVLFGMAWRMKQLIEDSIRDADAEDCEEDPHTGEGGGVRSSADPSNVSPVPQSPLHPALRSLGSGAVDISGRRQHSKASSRVNSKDSRGSRQRSIADAFAPTPTPEHTGVEHVRSVSVA